MKVSAESNTTAGLLGRRQQRIYSLVPRGGNAGEVALEYPSVVHASVPALPKQHSTLLHQHSPSLQSRSDCLTG